jgi:hypothetical protein
MQPATSIRASCHVAHAPVQDLIHNDVGPLLPHHSRHFLETRRRQRLLHPLNIRGGQQLAISAIEQFTNLAMRELFALCARHPLQHNPVLVVCGRCS